MALVRPTLLLSPDGSFDRNGAVSLSTSGTVNVVAGQYGNAWQSPDGSGIVNFSAYRSAANVDSSTVLVRFKDADPVEARTEYLISFGQIGGTVNHMSVLLRSTGKIGFRDIGSIVETPVARTVNHMTVGFRWTPTQSLMLVDGVLARSQGRQTYPGGDWALSLANLLYSSNVSAKSPFYGLLESALVYPVALPESEIVRISAMPAAWSMENAAAQVGSSRRRDGLLLPV